MRPSEVKAVRQIANRLDSGAVVVQGQSFTTRERMVIPLWFTVLEGLGRWVRRMLGALGRLVAGWPVTTSLLVTAVVVHHNVGWSAVVAELVLVLVVSVVWARARPEAWQRWVVGPWRSWWRMKRIYDRRWRDLMIGCGLLDVADDHEIMTQLVKIRSYPQHDELVLSLAPGQVPSDVISQCEAIQHGIGAWSVSGRSMERGRVALLVLWSDPLTSTIRPRMSELASQADPGHDPDQDPDRDPDAIGDPEAAWAVDRQPVTAINAVSRAVAGGGSDGPGEKVTPVGLLARLSAVEVGIEESGCPWWVNLAPGRHTLVIGTTGAGKSGFIWSTLWSLQDLIRAGWIKVTALDPKFIELQDLPRTGLGEVARKVPAIVTRLEELVVELDQRCEEMTDRKWLPSLAQPYRIVIVDELATLTVLGDASDKKRVEKALGALMSRGRAAGFVVILTSVEATKDVVRWRGLAANRVCYRTDDADTDLTLGEGAHDAGARTEEISPDTPGIAFARIQGRAGIFRVRTLEITDDHIDALVADHTAATAAIGAAESMGMANPSVTSTDGESGTLDEAA